LTAIQYGCLNSSYSRVNRLKHGFTRQAQPDDVQPPLGIDAVEPPILADDEMAPPIGPGNPAPSRQQVTQSQHNHATRQPAPDTDVNNRTNVNAYFEVERILRKRYQNRSWQYRVKWLSFDNSYNSWVEFQDLDSKCQDLVTRTHYKIPTDKRSQRKK
jgi:hypothetical protein